MKKLWHIFTLLALTGCGGSGGGEREEATAVHLLSCIREQDCYELYAMVEPSKLSALKAAWPCNQGESILRARCRGGKLFCKNEWSNKRGAINAKMTAIMHYKDFEINDAKKACSQEGNLYNAVPPEGVFFEEQPDRPVEGYVP